MPKVVSNETILEDYEEVLRWVQDREVIGGEREGEEITGLWDEAVRKAEEKDWGGGEGLGGWAVVGWRRVIDWRSESVLAYTLWYS